MDKGNIQDWLEEWFELSQMNSSIELGTNNEAGPAEVTGFSRKADKIPKRKKHRPKVVKEKKITKIQKSTTGKPAKEKETRSTGKRKYVRKKGLSATTNQPPSEDSDMQNKAGKIKARRSLNFNEDDRQKNADQASQAQVTEASFNPEDPRSSIYAVERTHAQVACHWGGTSSSISDSFNLMQANSVSNGLTFDLNYSINQIPNKCGNLMDGCGQLSESAPRETMQINQLQDFYARMPDKSGFHLNQMQNSSVNSGQYVHSSTENTSRSDQMIHGYMMPKYPAAHTQHTERVSIRQNANPKACTREAVTINQMLQDHRLPESPITPSIHSERDAMRSSLNEFSVQGDCLSFATNRNNHNEASFGLPNSYDFPQILTPVGNQREHGPMVSLDTSFQHSNSSRPIHNDPHSSSSRGSYLTETCRKVRSESQKNLLIGAMGKFSSSSAYLPSKWNTNEVSATNSGVCTLAESQKNLLIGAMGKFSSSSAYLPSKWNTNEVSATNSGVCTLADVQRSMALNKSRCHQRMISSGVSELSRVGRPNRVQQHNQSTLCNTSDIVFDAESTINSLGGNNVPNNIQRMGSHQLQSLEVGPTLHYSIDKDCIALPDKQLRYSTAEHMQLPSGTENPFIESYFPSDGIHQPQYLEKRMVKGPELVPETHHASAYDDTVNNYCIAIHEEQITGTGVEAVGQPISKSTRTDLRLLDASGENKEANPTKKPRGRPKKQQNNGKPKGRGTRKETVSRAKHLSSKGKCTDNEPILCGSEPSAGTNTKATTSESKRSAERTPSILEISDLDNYRSIGSKHIDGAITEVIALSADPLDAVIEKFNLLYISKSDEVIAAACNKGISDALVPLQGNANKKRSRPRVDIDPVTSLMWNLLMAPNMSDDAGGMDKDTEKLLDEERRVFRGRIDAFIARMHLVQGDRRFSPWKGSVVDSVVGVFLTQNVSDHLSSSAFMAVAAKFPVKPEGPEESTAEMSHTPPGQKDSCSGLFGDSIKLKGKFSVEEIHNTEFHEGSNSNKLIGSFSRDGFNFAAGKCSVPYRESLTDLHENRQSKFVVPESGIASVVEDEVPMEDASSSQNSAVSSQHSPDYPFHRTDPVGFSLLPYFPEKDHMMINLSNRMTSSTGHAEHPTMQDFQNKHNDMVGSSEYGVNLLPVSGVNKDVLLDLNRTYQAINTYVSYLQNGHVDSTGVPFVSHLDNSFCTGLDSMFHPNVAQPEASFYQLPSASTMSNRNKTKEADCSRNVLYCMDESLVQQKSHFPTEPSQNENFSPIMKQNFQPLISSVDASLSKEQLFCEYKFSSKDTEVPFAQQHECSNSQEVYRTRTKQMGGQSGCSQPQLQNIIRLQAETCENYCVSNLCENQNAHSQVSQGVADPIRKPEVTRKGSLEVPTDELKGKKVHRPKKKTCDWERIRKNLFDNDGDKPRSQNAKDSVDWEAVRQADVEGISETIRERGLNNMLAGRIKEFLNRLVRDHGSIDLEWLRDLEPEKAKEYLLSIRGLGLKSTECVRLLTLRHVAFPVDTNVARICVRLGWVPLQPLPESVQLHLLELYPVLDHIQKYLWPRLCKLDQLTLYELHYQMITFGKVFCSKRKPNCNACPMRAECKHFASAFASARLFLTGPEEKSSGASENLKVAGIGHQTYIDPRPVDHFEWNVNHHNHVVSGNHKPIVEEPSSPDPEPEIAAEASVEDLFTDDPDEIPTINLNMEEFTQNLRSYMLANNIDTEDTDMSKALVAITPEASSIPTPKLKNVSRLRTVHKVYELPDEHPILEGFDPREPDDPCPYHLSIWTPGETAQSADAPKIFCNFDETGKLCGSSTCFSCNSAREMQAQKVRATILIPCRTAMRGSFPLNGTYFQVNELFADHHSSINPIDVPREWIWNLPRRTVYFGTSTPTIFRGLTTEQIQLCFWTGFVCVRGFDRIQRALRPLNAGLHLPATKVTRDKRRAAAKEDE